MFQEFVKRKCKIEERNRKRSLPSWIVEENFTMHPPSKKPRVMPTEGNKSKLVEVVSLLEEKVHTVGIEFEQRISDGDVLTIRKERTILGGKRGRGKTVMRVRELADLFKLTPKRKQKYENSAVESPSKKPRNDAKILEDSNLVGTSAAESDQNPQYVESES